MKLVEQAYVYLHTTGDPMLNKLMITGFLHKLQNIFKDTSKRAEARDKLSLYLGHDRLIQALLTALVAVPIETPPEFSSFLTFELYRSSTGPESFFVKVLYNDEEYQIKGCSKENCELPLFLQILRDVTVSETEYQTLCSY